MISPEARLFCRLDQMPNLEQEQQRLQTLEELGLLESDSVPIFEEATQTAAHFLDAPICVLGLLDRDRLWFKSAIGLSRIGLMNDLASSRQLPRSESFCAHVVESQRVLAIPDTDADPMFANSILVKRYGIRSYLGAPLVASNGHYLGTLAVMGLAPRTYSSKEAEMLQLVARWSISEFERNRMLKSPVPIANLSNIANAPSTAPEISHPASTQPSPLPSVKARLISQMTQELCTPLTSILGMARVLEQGIYGTLTEKQREYIEIIYNSGQYLSSLVNEVMELGALDESSSYLNLNPIDIEMLCQQAISTLKQAAQRHNQQIQLTVEPGPRIWLLDKDRVRQMLYHLVFSVMQSSSPESVIRIHISRRQNFLNLMVWISHPWLGDGLPHTEFTSHQVLNSYSSSTTDIVRSRSSSSSHWMLDDTSDDHALPVDRSKPTQTTEPSGEESRQSLGLLLSRQLAELHGGCITVQGSHEEGYRYVIKLPQLRAKAEQEL